MKPCPLCGFPARIGDRKSWEERGHVTCSNQGEWDDPKCPMAGINEDTLPEWIRTKVWELLPRRAN